MRTRPRFVGMALAIVALLLVLGACSTTPTPAPTAPSTTAPVATPAPATPTATTQPAPTSAPLPTAAPTATPAPTAAAPAPAPVAQGMKLYTTYCSSCHGSDALGSSFAPSLSGHSEAVVKRQVRTPIGTMPAFPSATISDTDLEHIAEFIAGLASTEEHSEPVDMESATVLHHWMAIYGLQEDDINDAMHHVEHILEAVTDHEHQERMEGVLELIEHGDLHSAEHEIQEMLSGKADPHLSVAEIQLKLVMAALAQHDAQSAIHHMEDLLAIADETVAGSAHEVVEMLEAGDLQGAEHEVEELLEHLTNEPHEDEPHEDEPHEDEPHDEKETQG